MKIPIVHDTRHEASIKCNENDTTKTHCNYLKKLEIEFKMIGQYPAFIYCKEFQTKVNHIFVHKLKNSHVCYDICIVGWENIAELAKYNF